MQIFAYESALLFLLESSWVSLSLLLADDATAAEVLLREVPAIGLVARKELQTQGKYSDYLKEIVDFVWRRAMQVRGTLPSHDYEPAHPIGEEEDWREVSLTNAQVQIWRLIRSTDRNVLRSSASQITA